MLLETIRGTSKRKSDKSIRKRTSVSVTRQRVTDLSTEKRFNTCIIGVPGKTEMNYPQRPVEK